MLNQNLSDKVVTNSSFCFVFILMLIAYNVAIMVPGDGVSGSLLGLKIKDKACLF